MLKFTEMNGDKMVDRRQNDIPMVICVVAKCSKCGNIEKLYIDEKIKDSVKYECPVCENDEYVIIYRC